MAQGDQQHRKGRLTATVAVLILAGAVYGTIAVTSLLHGGLSFAEGANLVRSRWYVSGVIAPYTATDATWTTPLYFYLLGWWQSLVGAGINTSRALSVGLGVGNAILLFSICRRLTSNSLAAAATVLLLVATPTTAFFFALATPTATVSVLHLAAIWLLVAGLGRPRVGASIAFGLLCAALYFTRQNMILAVLMLVPLYIAAIGTKRRQHAAIVIGTVAVAVASLVAIFPHKFAGHAFHLPVISPYLERWGLLPLDLALIDETTTGASTVALALERISVTDIFNGVLLPFSGIVVLAALLFFVTGRSLRVLWIPSAYFFLLAAGHIVGMAGICSGCLHEYAVMFIAPGALAGGLTLAVLAARARARQISPAATIIGGAILATALNAFAPMAASSEAYRNFPAPLLALDAPTREAKQIETLSKWVETSVPTGEPVLLLHHLAPLPFAVFNTGLTFPVQSFNLAASYREIWPRLNANVREAAQAAVESESLWTDATLRRWLIRDYDLVLVTSDALETYPLAAKLLPQRFEVVASMSFGNTPISLYKRKPSQ